MTKKHLDTAARRCRLAAAFGLLAVVAAAGTMAAGQAFAEDGRRSSPPASSATGPGQGSGQGPGQGPGPSADKPQDAIAVLEHGLSEVAPDAVVSEASKVSYEPNRDGSPNAFGHLELAPTAAAESSEVMVTYSSTKPGDLERYTHCQYAPLTDCQVVELTDGSLVITYVVAGAPWVPDQGGLVAAHRIVEGNVVALSATAPHSDSEPVLTRDQLVALISQPEWADLEPAG
jgi:hypothetical protein